MITKQHNHDHFWIEDGQLYESYRTIRGLRYHHVAEVLGMPDTERCTESQLKEIQSKYFKMTVRP